MAPQINFVLFHTCTNCTPSLSRCTGKNTSANSELGISDHALRPKTAISFNEIKDRVNKQLEINPDWDPNVDPPVEDVKTGEDDGPHKPMNAWMSEDRLTSAATTK